MGGVAKSRSVMAAGLMILMAAAPLAAQKDDPARAEMLEARAEALEAAGPSQYGEAAELYRKAADLRMAGDPQAVHDLMKSGKLAYYAGSARRSLRTLVRAADMALAYGDVWNAALGYLDAGWVAAEMGEGARAYDLVVKGARLGQSPLIEASRREELARRVEGAFAS